MTVVGWWWDGDAVRIFLHIVAQVVEIQLLVWK